MRVPSNLYIFTVDTEEHAGGFERQLVAFISGQVGECNVGGEIAEATQEKMTQECPDILAWLDLHVSQEPDEHGTLRPASIWTTPGWINDGMGGLYKENAPPEEQKAVHERYARRVRSYYEPLIKQWKERDYAGEDSAGDEAERLAKQLEEQLERGPGRYPAYLSVALFLSHSPPPEVLEFLKKRSQEFAREHKDWADNPTPITITGYRLITKTTNLEEQKV